MSLRSIAALAPLVVACAGKAAAPAPPTPPWSTRTPDELLALAPTGTRTAVVVSARGLELVDRALAWLASRVEEFPDMAVQVGALQQQGAAMLGLPELKSLAGLGLGHDRGFARFTLAAGSVVVWPVTDRAAFVAAFDGERAAGDLDVIEFDGAEWRCREVRSAYACATDLALLEQLGTGSLAGKPERAGARGDLEIVSYGDVAVTAEDVGRPARETYVTIGLEPGELVMHGWIRAPRDGMFAELDSAPLRNDPGRASGFFSMALPEVLTRRASVILPELIAATIHDAIYVTVPSGTDDLAARVAIDDSTYLQNLFDRCDVLPVPRPFVLAHDGHDDGCAISSADVPSFTGAAWRDGDTLWLGRGYRKVSGATGPEPTAVGRELAEGEWHLATWGRGVGVSVLDAAEGWVIGGLDAAQWSRSLAWFEELGFGVRFDGDVTHLTGVVRSVLANPAPVADAMTELVSRALEGEDVIAEVKALAAAHPTSPLAGDVAAGHVGLMVPAAALYLYGAVVAPAQYAMTIDDERPEPAVGELDSQDVLARAAVAPSAEVKHVLVGWNGSTRIATHERSKADAAELAAELAEQLRVEPARIDGLMALHSDDPGSRNGRTYVVTPDGGFVAPFRDLSLRLTIGEVGVVETDFGYHVILRVAPPPPDPLESIAILARPAGTAEVQIQHLLIGWKETAPSGGVGPRADARTKAQAADLARELLAKVKAGGDMAALMKAHSDDPSSSIDGRSITITPGFSSMPRFTDLALRLKIGEAGLVKTALGWHVVKRVKPPAPDPLESTAILARKPVTTQAKVKHILLGWRDVNPGDARGEARTRAQLEALVKKTVAQLKRGAAIEPLMKELSEDPGSSESGTSYDASPDAPLVAPFKDLSLRLKVGEVGVVKTQFGIHIIKRVE